MAKKEREVKIRVAKTHKVSELALQGLWAYWRDEKYDEKEAIKLFRRLMSENPEVDVQIGEGQYNLEKKDE